MKLITSAEAAEKLGVHQTRVQALIKAGRLPAQLLGGIYLIEEKDLALVQDRKPGRPKKGAANAQTTKRARKATRKAGPTK
jgi:excisionase family DNA binding protein